MTMAPVKCAALYTQSMPLDSNQLLIYSDPPLFFFTEIIRCLPDEILLKGHMHGAPPPITL